MPKSKPIPCTKEEINALIKASMENDFYYTLFMTAKTTGRRLGEYLSVQVKDINFDKNVMMTIILKRGNPTKKEAILTEEVSRLLQQYIKRNALKLDDYVFRGKKTGRRQIQNMIKTYAKKAGIPHNIMFHNFRHYFITELVRQGWDYSQIAKLTGHTSIGTLVHYDSSVASDIKDKALAALKNI